MQKKNIPLLCIITFLQGMVFYSAIATLYRQAAGLTVFQITMLEGISIACSLVMEIPWGYVADRIGYRRTMIICNMLFLLSKVIFWQANGFAAFLAERLLLSVVISGLSGVDSSILYLSAPPESAQRSYGWYNACGEAGLLFSALIYSLFLSGRYRLTALLTIIPYAIAAILTFFLTEVCPEQRSSVNHGSMNSLYTQIRRQFKIPGMLPLVICGALFGETIHCITVYFNQLQYIRAGLSERVIGIAFIGAALIGFLSPLSAPITQKYGVNRLGQFLLLSAAACAALLAVLSNGFLSILLIFFMSAASTLWGPLLGAMENKMICTNDRATALSINAMAGDSLILLIDLVLGKAADLSLPLLFAICSALFLTVWLLYRSLPQFRV